MLDTIKQKFEDLGYTDVKVNVWRGVRIYVNLDTKHTFSYDINQGFKVSSLVLLPKAEFELAKSLIPDLKRAKHTFIDVN